MAEVELKNVTKTFQAGKVTAVRNVNLKIPEGVFATVLGPSGCGKTTILRIVAGLERADEGDILIGGQEVGHLHPSRRNIAMVFQNYALYPHMKVFDNIAIGLKLRGLGKDLIHKRVKEVSEMLRIEELLDRFPKQLSGGQQQRVALARALVREPDVFLLDEPLSNLDAQTRDATRSELKKLFNGLGATVLYVTHDQTEAMTMSDLMIVMDHREIQQIGEPRTIYADPAHRFVAEFIGAHRINLISGRLSEGSFISGDGSIKVDTGIGENAKVIMGIRPEHIDLGGGKEISGRGEVILVEPLGRDSIISLKTGELEIKLLSGETPRMGETVLFSFSPDDVRFFDGESGRRMRTAF